MKQTSNLQNIWPIFANHSDLDLIKQYESQIVTDAITDGDSDSVAPILSIYLTAKKEDDARRVLRRCMEGKLVLPSVSLISMFPVLDVADVTAVANNLAKRWSIIAPSENDLCEVDRAMEAHGWKSQADSIRKAIVAGAASRGNISDLMTVGNYYRHNGNSTQALAVCKEIVPTIEKFSHSDRQSVNELTDLITVLDSTEMRKENECSSCRANAKDRLDFHADQIRRRQCLEMAAQLNQTAFSLEANNDYAMAHKLYREALDIKQLNLRPDDPETANQMVDVARMAAAQKQFREAQTLFEQALAILRIHDVSNHSDTISALEKYGEVLNQMNQKDKAERICSDARTLARSSKK